jgi:hypothetical protein
MGFSSLRVKPFLFMIVKLAIALLNYLYERHLV